MILLVVRVNLTKTFFLVLITPVIPTRPAVFRSCLWFFTFNSFSFTVEIVWKHVINKIDNHSDNHVEDIKIKLAESIENVKE